MTLNDDRIAEIENLTRLNGRQKDRIRYMLGTPGGREFDLFKRLIGLTPGQARNLLTEEYQRRFLPDWSLESMLQVMGATQSWLELDDRIKRFVKIQEAGLWRRAPGHKAESVKAFQWELDYWDKARYLLEALPKTREFIRDKYSGKSAIPEQSWLFETCNLCWRTVPVKPESPLKRKFLCFEHDRRADDPVYRKHWRLQKAMYVEYGTALTRLKEQYPSGITDEEVAVRMRIEMTGPESVLPLVVQHMNSVGHDGEPVSLLRAFHGPFPKGLKPAYVAAMDIFFQDALLYPYLFTLHELSLAEAWLTVLQTDKRRRK